MNVYEWVEIALDEFDMVLVGTGKSTSMLNVYIDYSIVDTYTMYYMSI